MTRAIILVADSLGIGSAPDAKAFGDEGANTFGHIAEYMAKLGKPLKLPNLTKLGLVQACEDASNSDLNLPKQTFIGSYGYMEELSSGKDTPSGHWEMAGVPVLFEWGYFTDKQNSFPNEIIEKLKAKTGITGILGNQQASGTEILERLGDEHVRSGMPICYTSADSVFQVAAHQEHFGLDKLYDFCLAAREILDEYNIGRVIARPFLGDKADNYARTGNRRDFSVLPPSQTVLDKMVAKGGTVTSIGKIADIYAHQGITTSIKANGLDALMDTTIEQIKADTSEQIIFTNLVNFDQDFGHRRNTQGYAEALEYFDTRLSDLFLTMKQDDILFITADHGCDPTWEGTEHTREYVPILAYQKNEISKDLGCRKTFADMGQTIADMFDLPTLDHGVSFLPEIK